MLPLTIESTLKQRENVLARRRAEEALQRAHDELEVKVRQRTAEIASTVDRLNEEIEERKQAEEAQRRDHNLLRAVTEGTPEPIFLKDREGCYLMLNTAAVQAAGRSSADEIIGTDDTAHLPLETARQLQENDRHVMASGQPDVAQEVVEVEGNTRIYQTTKSPYRDEDGNVVGVIGVALDVTEQKQAEAALRESEERFRAIFEQAAVGVAQIETQTGRFLRINETYCNIVGHTREEMTATTFMEITHPDDLQTDLDNMQKLVAGEIREFTMEKRYFRKDGSIVWVDLTVSPMWSVGEEPVYHIAVVEDITARKHTEQLLQTSREEAEIRNRIADVFLTGADEEMYADVLEIVLDALQSEQGVFGYVDEEGAMVCPSMSRDVWQRCQIPDKEIVFPPETWGGIWGKALKEKKTLYCNEPFRVPEGHIPMLRAVDVPIVHRGQLIGNLLVANKATDYVERDVRLLEAIAAYIAPVLNARLQRDRQEKHRERAEEALRESEERFRRAFEDSAVGMALVDTSGRYTEVNRALSGVLGYSRRELLTMGTNDVTYPGDVNTNNDIARRLRAGKIDSFTLQKRYVHKDGHTVWADVVASAVRDSDGKLMYSLGQLQDVTESKLNEEKLRQEAAMRSNLLDNLPCIAMILEKGTREIVASNQAARDIGAVPGQTCYATCAQRDDNCPWCLAPEVWATDEPRRLEVEYRGTHYEGIWVPLDEDRYAHYIFDISERKRTEAELRRYQVELNTIFNSDPTAIWYKNRHNEIMRVNNAGADALGLQVEDIENKPVKELFPEADADHYFEDDVEVMESGRAKLNIAERMQTASGQRRWVSTDKIPYRNEDGEITGVIAFVRDVTERKRAEEQLAQSLQESQLRRHEVAALLDGAQAVLENREFDSAARSIFDSCKNLIGAASGYMALLSEDGTENEVLFFDAGGAPCTVDPELPMPIRGLRETAYRNGTPEFENDFAHSGWAEFLPEGHVSLKNVLFAPLLIDGEAVGLMGIANKPGGFTDRDVRMAKAFGELAAIALSNSRTLHSLEASERRYRGLFEQSNDAVFVHDLDGTVLDVNRRACGLLGYTREEMLGKNVSEFHPESELATSGRAIETTRKTGAAQFETQMVRADGTPIDVDINAGITDPMAKIVQGIVRDVSARKQTEADLSIRNRVNEIFLTADDEHVYGGVLDFSRELLESEIGTFGYFNEDGSFVTPVITREAYWEKCNIPEKERILDKGTFSGIWLQAIDAKEVLYSNSGPFRTPEGHVAIENTIVAPVVYRGNVISAIHLANKPGGYDDDDKRLLATIAGYVAPVLDARLQRDARERDRTKYEEQLAEAKVAAEAANRAKSLFLANMSHEIRTPMTAIMGFTDLLLSREWPPSQRREHLETIRRNTHNLLRVINDILDLSKIEADKFEIEPADCSPKEIVEEVCSLVRSRAAEKGLAVDVTYTHPIPDRVRTDPVRLRQVLLNLLGNAVKFTERGRVTVRLRHVPREEDAGQMQFEVSDTGIGMSEDEVRRVFQPFTQADMSHTRRFGGVGLGLYVARRITEMLGGRLDVQSEPGVGSTFALTIDVGRPAARQLPADPHAPRAGGSAEQPAPRKLEGRVLVVEDVPEVRLLIRITLRAAGLEVDLAEDGEVAVKMALASRAQQRPYDLILMDVQMPAMDGLEATGQLRGAGWDLPIVALTAHAMTGDRERCTAAGCDDYITKPMTEEHLFDTITRHLSPQEAAPPAASSAGIDVEESARLQLLEEFVGKLPALSGKIERALQANDLPALQKLLHQLKGTAGAYGLLEIAETAQQAHERAGGEADVGQLAELVLELMALCRQAAKGRATKGGATGAANNASAARQDDTD